MNAIQRNTVEKKKYLNAKMRLDIPRFDTRQFDEF